MGWPRLPRAWAFTCKAANMLDSSASGRQRLLPPPTPWQVHSLKSIIRPQQKRQQPRVIGQRSAPLSADERGALLGEQPLPATQQGWAAGVTGAPVQAAAGAELPQALRRQLMNVAEADRMRLQQMLSRNFVSAESKEMLQPGTEAEAVAGLRPGAPAPAPRAPVTMAAGGIGKVVTEADLARPVEASAAAVGGRGLALQPAAAAGAGAAKRLPVRRVEEWRPAALLCKRFNVPDPYLGRPAELQASLVCGAGVLACRLSLVCLPPCPFA